MQKLLFPVLYLLLMISCKKESLVKTQQSSSVSNAVAAITTTEATYWDSVFTRYGNGWTGGDGAISYKLPDGRVMWLWGDSFLDTVYQDRHRPVVGFIHNQVTTMDMNGGNFTTYYGGTKKNPLPYFQASGSDFYWPVFSFMNNNNTGVYVFLNRVEAFGTGAFDFKVIGVDVAVLNYPSLSIQKIVPFSRDTTVNWGGDAFENSDGYVYLYGAESTKYNKYVHVARTSKSNPLNVTYWNGSTWTNNPDSSARVLGGVSQGFSFFQYQGKQYLLSQENLLGPNIYIWNAASPVGPFTKKRLVYTTPQKVDNIPVWTYNAKAHLEFTTNNQLLVGYCTNSQTSNGLYKDADTYRPYFVWASNWQ
jgi:hypothetical protein